MRIQLIASALCFALPCAAVAAQSPWKAIVVGTQADCERLATVDLQRYIGQVTGTVPVIIDTKRWSAAPKAAVVLGTPAGNPALKGMGIEGQKLGEQGFYLVNQRIGGVPVVVAAGLTPKGATNAVYGLLRELGFGFYLGSESVPGSLPGALPGGPIVRQPALRVRGVLPWYNFFNSPTAWDPIDHRAFADQLIRMGANFLGFHTYDHEPFAGYEEDGKFYWAGRLLNTGTPTWGTNSLPATGFGFGTDKLYADDFFGAATTVAIEDPNEAIRAEQDIMRDALDYAKKRGLYTCLGFELFGDPLNPEYREVFLKRLNMMLDRYPSLDYIWLWQAETQGAQGFRQNYNLHILPSRLDPKSPLVNYGAARRDVFRRIVERTAGAPPFFQNNEEGEVARANEGARLEQFGMLAHRAMQHRRNPPKLVISGWGGDERILSAEYYDGLDKLLPEDVVFSSLDNIVPLPRVDRVYGELPSGRERWPIPWLENDGDQWQPQPFVHTYESLMKDVHQGCSQGILGIHWRTRDLDENFAYLVRSAWDPALTAEQFFGDFARRGYDARIAGEMAEIHIALDKLGYRWVGGAGQVECGHFGWGPGDQGKARELEALRERARALLPNAGKSGDRLTWLIRQMDWVLEYWQAEVAAVTARGILEQAKQAKGDEAARLAKTALQTLDAGDLGRAMRTFARRVTTRGEYGVLATINTKAYAAWRDLRKECLRLSGMEEDAAPANATAAQRTSGEWNASPEIVLPRLIASVEAGSDLEVMPIALGGSDAWVHYRPLGLAKWTTLKTSIARGWVRRAVIPAAAIAEPGVQLGFSFSSDPARPMSLGPITVSVLPKIEVDKAPRLVMPLGPAADLRPQVREGDVLPLELTWNEIIDADFYRVYRDGRLVVETGVAMLPDIPEQMRGVYRVEAVRGGRTIARGSVDYAVPDRPCTERVELSLQANQAGVFLHWPAPTSPDTMLYKVMRAARRSGEPEVVAEVRAVRGSGHVYRDSPPAGDWTYSVTAVNTCRRESSPGEASISFPPEPNRKPALDLMLTEKPHDCRVVGNVVLSEDGATFRGGYVEVPHRDGFNLGYGMTMRFQFKADSVEEMPVLLSHGAWQIDGWFVQILGGKLIMRAAGGDAEGPEIRPGKWYTVRLVFDGEKLQLAVDGKWMPQQAGVVRDTPAARSLVIGHYEIREAQHAFKGSIRRLAIFNDVFMDGGE